MTKKPQGKQSPKTAGEQDMKPIIVGFVFIAVGLLSAVSIISFIFTGGADRSIFDLSFTELLTNTELSISNPIGKLGAWFSDMLVTNGVGIMALTVPAFLIVIGLKLFGLRQLSLFRIFSTLFLATVWGSIFLGFVCQGLADEHYFLIGGAHGHYVSRWLISSIGGIGTAVLLLITLLIYLIIKVECVRGYVTLAVEKITNGRIRLPKFNLSMDTDEGGKFESDEEQTVEENKVVDTAETEGTLVMNETTVEPSDEPETKIFREPKSVETDEEAEEDNESGEFVINEGVKEDVVSGDNRGSLDTPYDPTLDLENYHYPSFDLLVDYEKRNGDDAPEKIEERRRELDANKNKIVDTLDTFKIGVQKIEATIGPTVTLYEIVPVPGVKISRVQSLENDIALSLAALSVRIIAPIPGKGTIGIEVPNSKPKIVSMLSVLKSSAYQKSNYELPVVLGKTISNETYVFDLAKAPHLLVAGATGQGKSVGLNVLLTSLLYKKHPSQVKFVLIDPKMVEFSIYSKLEKHFLAKLPGEEEAIITDSEKAKATLNSLVQEMEDRYSLIKGIARNIKEYNEKFIRRELNPEHGHKFLPYIVVIIDEYGDLVMVAGKEIETPITRIAQKARAVGIHVVLATQRPSTNVVTGIIKANFPSRIAFRVSSMVDSRTVLDATGAQHLVGRGDMLVSIAGGATTRVQCALVDTDEVIAINNFVSSQAGYAHAFELPEISMAGDGGSSSGGSGGDLAPGQFDPMLGEAARLVIQIGKGSTSSVQRSLSLGFNRAGRIMDQLERIGVVGPADGSKPRNVYVATESELEQILHNFGIKG